MKKKIPEIILIALIVVVIGVIMILDKNEKRKDVERQQQIEAFEEANETKNDSSYESSIGDSSYNYVSDANKIYLMYPDIPYDFFMEYGANVNDFLKDKGYLGTEVKVKTVTKTAYTYTIKSEILGTEKKLITTFKQYDYSFSNEITE